MCFDDGMRIPFYFFQQLNGVRLACLYVGEKL